ncbi:NB-ARC domain-containing protein [Streptomyces sp. NPDC094038]|uniref:NB-ARC domain-containing protein n=1 Tax=Streptomyces sp. NPDC094038 TaxID=3366055 RepID=UPI0038091FB3
MNSTNLSTLLSAHRRRAGLTQEQLSERSGISVRAISDIEGGRVQWPRRRTQEALATALGATSEGQGLFRRAARPGQTGGTGAARWPLSPIPMDVADFTGRAAEIGTLIELASGPGGVAVLHGAPGTGKTSTAVHFGQFMTDRFPDGQIFVSVGDRADPGVLLEGMGVAKAAVPRNATERSAMQRAMLAGKRILLILDDVVSPEQVDMVPTGEPGLLTLITSRGPLSNLAEATMIKVNALPHQDALGLLAAIVGPDRVALELAAASEVVRLCDCLPLAVRAAGNRLASRPGWPIGHLAARLGDCWRRLPLLKTADERIATSLETACRRLSPDGARTFRRLGSASTIADPACATEALRELVDVGLIETDPQGRYTMLGLVRDFAAQYTRAAATTNGPY